MVIPAADRYKGQTSWLADLGNGVFPAAYTSREGMDPGIKVVVSETRDGPGTWTMR